jgi:SAM-dependent methyltransferase
MSAIREAALKRPWRAVTPRTDPPVSLSPLILSPEFTAANDTTYHVNDLLQYHDRDFIRNAYRAILKREPDDAGFRHNQQLLQSGAFNKIDILSSLRYSEEGKHIGVAINGLRFPATIRTLERIPLIGYLLQLLIGLVRLPAMIRSQREFQGFILAQQSLIADHINGTQQIALSDRHRYDTAFLSLSDGVKTHLTKLQQELRTLDTTFLTRLLEEQQKLQQLSSRLDQISETHDRLSNDVQTLARNLAGEGNRTVEERREWDNFYAAFEEQFRGSTEEVAERLRFYLPYLKQLDHGSKIVDLGSGRGDWLDLLTKEGFRPQGIEINDVLAERARAKGFDVSNVEMMVYLGRQPDNSLDVVTVFHLIEHFNVDKLIRLLEEIRRTLKPGGLLMLETPSPENLVVGACTFYADPTHFKPIYPQTLMFLLNNLGFVGLELQFLHPVDQSPFADDGKGSEQLNNWFFGPRDFSAIARKAQ